MKPASVDPAAVSQPTPQRIELSGSWIARGSAASSASSTRCAPPRRPRRWSTARASTRSTPPAPGCCSRLLLRLRDDGAVVTLRGLRPEFARLLDVVAQHAAGRSAAPRAPPPRAPLRWRWSASAAALAPPSKQALALLGFVGETARGARRLRARTRARLRWRPILFNIRSAGFDALPIVGLLSFLLGVVVAYQGADQLRQYGANIFVADLVGLSMLREFAPLITAIIVAGRSGSAYAAQIGTMAVTEEIDAMRTLGIAPLELLVLPKLIALVIALPLLTVFADVLGVFGGMLMARAQLGVGFAEFLDRFVKAVSLTAYADRHRQGAGVRRHHRRGRLLPGLSHPRRRRQRRAARPRAAWCSRSSS